MIISNSAEVVLWAESRLTARSQTTIPAAIRDALHLQAAEVCFFVAVPGVKQLSLPGLMMKEPPQSEESLESQDNGGDAHAVK